MVGRRRVDGLPLGDGDHREAGGVGGRSGFVRQNVGIARGFRPLGALEMQRIRTRYAEPAMDGRFELYKTTAKHEADVGRKQRGFPLQAELGG